MLVIESWIEQENQNTSRAEIILKHARDCKSGLQRSMILTGIPQLELADLYLKAGRKDEAYNFLASLISRLTRKKMPGVLLAETRRIVPVLELAIDKKLEPDFCKGILLNWQDQLKPRPIQVPGTEEILSAREAEVLQHICNGLNNKAIAETLFISERTVKSHVTKILAKLGATSRTQAAARARALQLF